ncbi:beta-lactamase [Microbulbifer sp. CAU 1566]|uniref:class C beta-lactamase n=1 Tax=Microbulbifer sp. CAU 1566 TaxID=2933269 RepID=UPI002004243D|nr:class C beta-lactamase [Microbulbifer sp. CAU 1566]MCK7596584.1 beta-lactamase [Microbulbifer sp. CAU 1566]
MPLLGLKLRHVLAWGLMALCVSASSFAAPARVDPEKLQALVVDAIRPVVEKYEVPGMALALTVDGEPYFFNMGETSAEAGNLVTEHTLFEIGSVSKTFTATLAAYAELTGALSLKDPVSLHLPELRGSAMDGVTLLNLATHTAGHFPLQVPSDIENNRQLLAYLKQWQPQYFPGTSRTYANPGIGLLGLITAEKLRQPYAKVMQEKIFQGLGLGDTYISVPAEKMSDYAQGYNRDDKAVRVNIGVLGEEAYGVKSSAADLVRYLGIHMQLVQASPELEKALAATREGHFKTEFYVQDLVWEQYALPVRADTLLQGNSRMMITEDHPVEPIRPPLAPQKNVLINKTGSTSGFSTYVAFIPEQRFGFVLLANKYFPNDARIEVLYKILQVLLPEVTVTGAATSPKLTSKK